ncbi:MAG TPA: metal-dependent transcriptional regulator [Verrucomicrobiae bacterium]|nr:metal-dependent transcriptional regulator [Verrucomicrobiae bacterium]
MEAKPTAPAPAPARARERSQPSLTIARYLEAVYYLSHEGEVVRPGRLAEWLGVGAPTVSAALQRMRRDDLIAVARDHPVRLTAQGSRTAAAIVRRHRVAERWLTDTLGFDWATADEEAGPMAHALSDQVVDRLHRLLGSPATCPHGNQIPGEPTSSRRLVRLSQAEPGRSARVGRISELAEHEAPELLRLLDREGIRPGAQVEVGPWSGRASVRTIGVEGRTVRLGDAAARAIWVEPDPGAGRRRSASSR